MRKYFLRRLRKHSYRLFRESARFWPAMLVLSTPDLVFSQPQYKAALSFAVSAAIAEFGMAIKAEAILDELRKRHRV